MKYFQSHLALHQVCPICRVLSFFFLNPRSYRNIFLKFSISNPGKCILQATESNCNFIHCFCWVFISPSLMWKGERKTKCHIFWRSWYRQLLIMCDRPSFQIVNWYFTAFFLLEVIPFMLFRQRYNFWGLPVIETENGI